MVKVYFIYLIVEYQNAKKQKQKHAQKNLPSLEKAENRHY
jgi:hypothetical protein